MYYNQKLKITLTEDEKNGLVTKHFEKNISQSVNIFLCKILNVRYLHLHHSSSAQSALER